MKQSQSARRLEGERGRRDGRLCAVDTRRVHLHDGAEGGRARVRLHGAGRGEIGGREWVRRPCTGGARRPTWIDQISRIKPNECNAYDCIVMLYHLALQNIMVKKQRAVLRSTPSMLCIARA